tara:strand:+ start:932 stop:1144 length:213 start_codon:yes stop_codon:yes gene_type:complete
MKDLCVICGEESLYDENEHVELRLGYIECVGQLCLDCYEQTYMRLWYTLDPEVIQQHIEEAENAEKENDY